MSRRLKPEEIELWNKVASTAERYHQPRKIESQEKRPSRKPAPKAEVDLPRFKVGQSGNGQSQGHDILPPVSERLHNAPVRMDRKTHTKLKRGKVKPEARIDLHGMTMDRAHPALNGFIMRCASEGKRLVLVITGKGKDRDEGGPIPIRRGILRHQVPHWLSVPPLSQLILQITPAHDRHGGGGAYYVYLKRLR
ncbi:Smr/MutS family protein [Pseudooceanicola atlanticus]|uniref:DNA mismatch repair protein MutS n=1 Tax=Pseudooceanicola atlanticus TaxID=1461694 RepID=A0A0A0E9G7_9RHOB|nr:Smr/MutS family protein [Pseudooceanicola atlanticus]KGM47104.1 DNA mismatch repair protein MutS [Pseudooceanicola atlanticus]